MPKPPFKGKRTGGSRFGGDRPSFGGKKSFGNKSFGGERKSFGGKKPWERGSDSREGGQVTMHRATCAECGDSCQVPFKPNGSKPVLCSNCFGGSRDAAPKRSFGGDRDERRPSPSFAPRGGDADQLRAINAKLDAILKALNGEE